MQFQHTSDRVNVSRQVEVIDGPVLAHPSSGTGKKFRLERFSVTFSYRCGSWEVQNLNVTGPVLKSDGTDSQITYHGRAGYAWENRSGYAGVRRAVEGMVPEGLPELPFRVTSAGDDELEGS